MKHLPLRRLAAALIGFVFLVSGLLKIADPVGTMLIVTEYLKFFHLQLLIPAARGLGIALALTESLLGIALVTGVLRKITAWATTCLLGIFTVITLILWVVNPSMDCGCFGEAIHLSHTQSFWKNVVLLALAACAFLPFKDFGKTPVRKIVSASIAVVSVLVAVVYSNTHLPLVDHTDFHPGAEIFASLEDEVVADNHYREARTYEKDGQRGQFYPGHYPADTAWKLIQTDTVFWQGPAASERFPILGFRDAGNEYRDRLAAEGRVFVLSVYKPEKAPWARIRKHYKAIEEAGGTPLLLVATAPSEVDRYEIPIDLTVYYADYKTLITLNRDNAGVTYLYDGEIIEKWMSRDFPDGQVTAYVNDDPVNLSTHRMIRKRLTAQGFCLYLAALLLLV